MSHRLALIAAIAGSAALLPAGAYAVPSVKIGSAALISPTNANAAFPSASDTTHTNSLGTTGRPDEIVELARALKNDPDLIYDFVHNNMDTVWMYGLQKGAMGVIIDRSGTPFDQAHLMVELLRQAGFASATYKVGTITLNATQFSDWTGVSTAAAACQLLASGGIPAVINGSTGTASCTSITGSVTSVELGHIWVSVSISGTTYVFDPSYKAHTFKPGIDLAVTAGLTTGQAMAQVGTGMTSGTDSGFSYSTNLGTEALNTVLQNYGNGLLTYAQDHLLAGDVEDLVGGADIQRDDTVVRQASLPYTSSVQRTWSSEIPDQFRTSLRVQVTKAFPDGSTPQIIDKTFYADDVYGRKLNLTGSFNITGANTTVTLSVVNEAGAATNVFSQLYSHNPAYNVGALTLSVNHPYPASADGTVTTGLNYMDDVVTKPVRYTVPLTIIHGWGDTGRGLVEKWGSRIDGVLPNLISQGCETCNVEYAASTGDGRREQLVASWLSQSSRAARLHAAIAKAVYSHHHSIGIATSDSELKTTNIAPEGGTPSYRYQVVDNFDRIDVDSAFSLTSKTADAVARRAAVHAIAETTEALEGSVAAQTADLPDTASTATRFEWANRPPVAEDPSASATTSVGPRRFYDFTVATGSQVNGLAKVEGQFTTANDGVHDGSDPEIGSTEFSSRKNALSNAVALYSSAGFNVIASEEAFLGPGQRGGAFDKQGSTSFYLHRQSKQRGGAFVATRYVGGEPVEIAHVAVGPDANAKGGGGGAQPGHQAQYDPSQAADVLKSRFVDRSKVLGVDLLGGNVTATSPASLSVGNGGFPYELSASLIWIGGNSKTSAFGPESHTEPQAPWTTNWNNTLTVSGSGLEAMGDGDIRATVGTVAAFLAAQDVYKSTASIKREVTGALVGAWWVRQLTGNVVTANVGANTRQFVKLFNGTWIAPGAGPHATLTQTGNRAVFVQPNCGFSSPSYVGTRGWDYSGVSYKVTNAHGDQQNFSYWSYIFQPGDSSYCANQHGFRLSSWTFPQGMTLNLMYSTPGLGQVPELTEVNNSLGRRISFISSGRGGFTNGLTGGDLRSVTVTGDPLAAGTITHTEPSGAVNKFVASIVGEKYLLTQIFDADSSTTPAVQYDYDTLRRVKEARDAIALKVGGRQPYQFLIGEGVRGERIDPAGGHYSVLYDARKRAFRFIDEIYRVTQAKYDGRGRTSEYEYPEGDKETFAYDGQNNTTLLTRIPKPASGMSSLTIQAQWHQTWNKPTWIIDARGKQTDFVYYPSGNGASLLNMVTRPAAVVGGTRPVYTFTYNSRGQVLDATDPTLLVTTNTYDPNNGNLLTNSIDPAGVNILTSFGYDAIGNTTSITDPRLNVTENTYDNNRRTTVVRQHNGNIAAAVIAAKRTNYDLLGRVTSEEGGTAFSGTSVTTWQTLKTTTYTKTSKVYTQANGAGNTTTYTYDPMDRVDQVSDPVSRLTKFQYDLAGQTLKEIRAYASPLQQDYATYTYSSNGQRETVRDANNNLSTLEYDGLDRVAKLRFPMPTLGANASSTTDYEQYGYDNNGNRTSVRKRDGQTIGYTFDDLNRETVKDIPGGTAADVYSGYDLAGHPSYARFVSHAGSGIDYGYDSAKRLTSETTYGRTLAFQYDQNGNRTRLTYPDTNYIAYEYDALNRMTFVRENGATSGAGVLAQYRWDPLSRRDATNPMTRGNGTATGYAYDGASRLTGLSHDAANTSQDVALGFAYTLASQLHIRTNSNALYDWTAPVQTRSYAANGLNQYSSVSSVSHSYDTKGNLTGDGSRTFTYDVENRLVTMGGTTTGAIGYDPLGRLQNALFSGVATQFLYEGDRLIAEYDGTGTLLRRFVHGPGVDEPIVWYEGGSLGTRRWLHADERGSIVAYTDASGLSTPYAYGPYGEQANWTGSRFRYTGQIMLPEAQLYYYKARVYDPQLGRFLQTDPIGYKDDFNLYAYVGNDPLNKTDPTGMDAWDDVRNGFFQGVSDASQSQGYPDVTDGTANKSSAAFALGKGLGAGLVVQAAFGGRGPKSSIPDNHVVARGGAKITPESIEKGTSDTKVGRGFSANSAPTVAGAATDIKHNQVGVTTAGDVRAAGGEVHDTSHKGNPTHVTVTGLESSKASELLSPSVKNPVPPCDRRCNQ